MTQKPQKRTIRKAEALYIDENIPLEEICNTLNVEPSAFTPYLEDWEFRRQCLHTARQLFVRHGLTKETILQTVPIAKHDIDARLSQWETQRLAYLAPLPSSHLRLQRMVDREIATYYSRLKPAPGIEKLAALSERLKGMTSVLDQVEGFVYLFTESFLPTVNLDDTQRALVDRLLAEFRGFLKLQLLSGNR